ncbi:MAG: NUDIX hydrolase [Actinomycetota bacterium]
MPKDFETRLRAALSSPGPRRVSLDDARDAAVLIPFVGGGEPSLIFTVRTETLPSHKGQISFPGGSVDPDEETQQTALRETFEELAVDPSSVRILGELDSVPTFVSGYVVHPVVGWLDELPELVPNESEVADVLLVPLAELSDDIWSAPGFTHAGRTYPTEAWIWRDRVIWGVTARILRLLLIRLARAGLASAPAAADPWTVPTGTP